MSITRLEHLANEIFYEIFEYLDSYFVCNIFSHLNTRFEYLLKYSSLPMKVNLSWTSKSEFNHYCQQIIARNLNRTISLTIPNPLAIKAFLTLFPINNSSFDRLESFNLGRMDSEQTRLLLTCLQTLPRLFSLSITIDYLTCYQLIITLPVLKYCKISSENDESIFSMPIIPRNSEQKESTLEHLMINAVCQLDQLAAILSYTPCLIHLSCRGVQTTENPVFDPPLIVNLKKLSLDIITVPFHLFQSFICKISSQLEVLQISAKFQKTYFNANQWKTLISYHLPYLRVLDIQLKSELCHNRSKAVEYDQLIERFQSEFWIGRQWFFTYQNAQENDGLFKYFCSIRPYRRKYYKLHEQPTATDSMSLQHDSSTRLCRHVLIANQWINTDESIHFPYATKLTLTGSYAPEIHPWIHNLTSVIPLTQITELILDYEYLFINKLLMLLKYMPNVNSLIIPQMGIVRMSKVLEDDLNAISTLSSSNRITKVMVTKGECTLPQLRCLFNLCPYMEHLSIDLPNTCEHMIIEFLISKMKERNSRLFFLFLTRSNPNTNIQEYIRSLIHSDTYSFDLSAETLYLWR